MCWIESFSITNKYFLLIHLTSQQCLRASTYFEGTVGLSGENAHVISLYMKTEDVLDRVFFNNKQILPFNSLNFPTVLESLHIFFPNTYLIQYETNCSARRSRAGFVLNAKIKETFSSLLIC